MQRRNLPTPAPTPSGDSVASTMSQTPAKRPRRDSDACPDEYALDVEVTPRPARTHASSLASDRETGTASQASNRRTLEAPHAHPRDVDLPPGLPGLVEVLKSLPQLGRGRGVIPAAHKACWLSAVLGLSATGAAVFS